MSPPLRLFSAALVASFVIAAAGLGWEVQRFGLNEADAARGLERDVRQHISERSQRVESLATRVAANRDLIARATASRDGLPALFTELANVSGSMPGALVTVTVYVLDRPGAYRVLGWSEGPAGEVARDRLAGPAALFVAPGTAGLRLVAVQPIDVDGRRAAVAAAETVLATTGPAGAPTLETPFGPVTIVPSYAAGALVTSNSFVVEHPRLGVQFSTEDIAGNRYGFRRRVLSIAAAPPFLALLLLAAPVLDRRRRTPSLGPWLGWSLAAVVCVGAACGGLILMSRALDTPSSIRSAMAMAAIVGAIAIVPGGLWWRRGRRLSPSSAPLRFLIEHLAVGALVATALVLGGSLLSRQIAATSLANWKSALFPLDPVGLLDVWTVRLGGLAAWWTAAALIAVFAGRWRVTFDRTAAIPAAACWLLPAALVLTGQRPAGLPIGASLVLLSALAAFGLSATWLRRQYRHATQSARLLLAFLALVAPLASLYPMTAVAIEQTSRSVIERDLGPETAGQPEQIGEVLLKTQEEIDALKTLPDQLRSSPPQPLETQTAFLVWNQTSLKTTRVVSDIALYGPNGSLISRFALNFPDYLYRASEQKVESASCGWEVVGGAVRLGTQDRAMLHAQRGFCDRTGRFAGAVVMHVAPSDYQALPFLAPVNPYSDLLRGDSATPRAIAPPGLELVVFGWSLQPLFTSRPGLAWSIDVPVFERIYKAGTPLWTDLESEGNRYHVHLLQNRAGIYALGYPETTWLDHAARLAEIAAVAAVVFVLVQIAVAIGAPLVRRAEAPLRVLLHEVRTSFYRKLFLFFVLVAVGPVLLFAIAFSAYMTTKFRADVESEAASVVTVARRVFEQVAEQPASPPPTDDVMVWIRQVIDEDVNLFEGSELVATSQRDLFNSGLLPTRTPALVYRRIALDRLPSFVTEDRQYLVAASPVPARGRDAILSVPLAPRQREIEQEVDELKRGVLAGSVLVILFAAWLGASLATRVSDPVARLTKATRQIAAGRLDVRIAADTADELKRLVDDFNSMTATLVAQRAELARTNQLKAWNEMARQVAHEIKNPLTPIQLATEHLKRVHDDQRRPLGDVFDQCVTTVLGQVRLLRQIASEFANFAGEPASRPEPVALADLIGAVVDPYRLGLAGRVSFAVDVARTLPLVNADRMLLLRAFTNLVENAIQAMPLGGTLQIGGTAAGGSVVVRIEDTGVGMDEQAVARAFEPYFSTKTGGSGLGLANARRNIELQGGTIHLASVAGQGTTITIHLPTSGSPGGAP